LVFQHKRGRGTMCGRAPGGLANGTLQGFMAWYCSYQIRAGPARFRCGRIESEANAWLREFPVGAGSGWPLEIGKFPNQRLIVYPVIWPVAERPQGQFPARAFVSQAEKNIRPVRARQTFVGCIAPHCRNRNAAAKFPGQKSPLGLSRRVRRSGEAHLAAHPGTREAK